MKWAPQQDDALKAVADWLKDPDDQVFRLFGYAGTGKTTLAKHLAEDVKGTVLFGAYTGKAAHVLRTKGCEGASTIHSMIYHAKDKARAKLKELEMSYAELYAELSVEAAPGEDVTEHRRLHDITDLIRQERDELSRPVFALNRDSPVRDAALVVIDECSMVDGPMGSDLVGFGTKILVLGDPAQLPPVMGGGYFTEKHEADFMLTDIHRQAQDNPIIAMATAVRNGETLSLGSYGDSRVAEGQDIGPDDAMQAGQILVGRNKTRHASNRRMRKLLGFDDPLPQDGDRLVCLRNNHELGLLNGAIWNVTERGHAGSDQVYLSLKSEEGDRSLDVDAHTHYFLGEEGKLAWWDKKEAEEFDYGYALTVHKAQGSQWGNVLLFDEAWCFRKDRNRWLYTGITRAAEKLTVVRV